MKKKNQSKNVTQYQVQIVRDIECVDWLGVIARLSGLEFNSKGLQDVKRRFLNGTESSEQEYQGILGKLTDTRNSILSRLMKEQKLSVVNPTSFQRKEYVRLDDGWYLAEVAGYDVATLTPMDGEDSGLVASEDSISNGIVTLNFDDRGDVACVRYGDKELEWKIVEKQFFKKGIFGAKRNCRRKFFSGCSYIDGARVVRENVFNYSCNSVVEQIALFRDEQKIEYTTRIAIKDANVGVKISAQG